MRRRSRGMAVLQKILNVLPLNEEQRRFQRVRVNLLGRYMLADRREFPCQVLDMSPGGMAVIGPVSGMAGERGVGYIHPVGRPEGTIFRLVPDGFAVSGAPAPPKRHKPPPPPPRVPQQPKLPPPPGRPP